MIGLIVSPSGEYVLAMDVSVYRKESGCSWRDRIRVRGDLVALDLRSICKNHGGNHGLHYFENCVWIKYLFGDFGRFLLFVYISVGVFVF